jgi:hypothetical protein
MRCESPDARWLAIQSLDRTRTNWKLHLLNFQTDQIEVITSAYRFAFPDYDWSANGQWLLRIDRDFLYLLAPDHDYQRDAFPNCSFAGWVNDQSNRQ